MNWLKKLKALRVPTLLNSGLWLLTLVGLMVMLLELMVSGRIAYLLHPRMYIFVWLGIGMLTVLAIHQLTVLFSQKNPPVEGSSKKTGKQRLKWGIVVFLIPLALGATRPELMAADVLTNKALLIGQNASAEKADAKTSEDASEDASANTVANTNENASGTINEAEATDDFYNQVTSLQTDFKERIGESLTLKGLVYRQDDFKDNQLVVARLLITCCASDAGVLGLLVQGEVPLTEYPADSWVEVTGTIEAYQYEDTTTKTTMTLPMLVLSSIQAIEPFSHPYVYPD